ncbi:MAG: undecaprenyl/decaprenyl-phosphate alpha-N-acetylglucosaminyl 1-phosphate transferase [Saprospiraceae bacterium]|nr:undecaprenyl/decaprenyl-phosphate alpha-N-acetylglucosaminyl 1-phosphate transferase [Saprospiraceae bacterium]
MYDIILSFLTAFLLTYFAIPSIIHVAKKKHLTDDPGERTSHSESTPSLGGIGIFAGVLFSIIFWTPFGVFADLQYILCSFIIIFLIGAKDDILPIDPTKKLIGQIVATLILIFKSNVKLTSFYGVFGVGLLPEWVAVVFSCFVILVIINAFNLIDGINGLTGTIASLISLTLGFWFLMVDQIELAIVGFALSGALIAFLKYNITPSRIFMGDTGSLLVGIICAILAIKFIEVHKEVKDSVYAFPAAPAMAVAILIIPLFDTLRVFTMRIIRGRSPFKPDRNHIHHLLIDSGNSHMQATGILLLVNIGFILLGWSLQGLGNLNLLIILVGLATLLTAVLFFNVRRKRIKAAVAVVEEKEKVESLP